jgi:hypothetical protein
MLVWDVGAAKYLIRIGAGPIYSSSRNEIGETYNDEVLCDKLHNKRLFHPSVCVMFNE